MSAKAEEDALVKRHAAARAAAIKRAADVSLERFEQAILSRSHAIINVNADFLWAFLREKRRLYVCYQMLVEARVRKPASFLDDTQRRGVDAILHGSLANRIVCAALSLDERGLESYGAAAISLADVTVAASATCLESNSFDFVSRFRLVPGDTIPPGYRCTWGRRGQLAAAKIADHIQHDTEPGAFARLLLRSNGRRADDEFVEVHIFGPFDWQSVASIAIQKSPASGTVERQILDNCRDLAVHAGIRWSE